MQTKWQATILRFFLSAAVFFMSNSSQAGTPMWTFTPNPAFPPNISLTQSGYAYVQYTVTNQSRKTKTLIMNSIPGITQITTPGNCPNPFTLAYQQYCTLTLFVDGSQLVGTIKGGPAVCEHGSPLQCYQPSNPLNITVRGARFVITPNAGANGTISPALPRTVVANSNLLFNATPNSGYQVYQWIVDGNPVQWGGLNFSLNNIIANHTVEVTFNQAATIFAGAENGHVYLSSDNGQTWIGTIPLPNHAVNSIYATSTDIYAGVGHYVYRYNNSSGSWDEGKSPDHSEVLSVFVTSENTQTIIYAGTKNGSLLYSTDDRKTWNNLFLPSAVTAVHGIYVTNGTIYIGSTESNEGHIYYSPVSGGSWTKIPGPADVKGIRDVFVVNHILYANTAPIQLPPDGDDKGPREYVYTYDLTTNGPWSSFIDQTVYSLFVSADGSTMLAGTQGGFVYSLVTGDLYGFITDTKINSVYLLSAN
ncbi:NHL repeat protein [Legionella gratiana]|uniref:NHL repeat protein n=2 Tax=Legionella gratiana TaxID=45066 RepID=A0A378JBN0_9GAMM|nr:hypothetical protein [Legionella gratiana]KTD14500.1 NHL repeat protein [Legionella gratiana]STX42000.1 NHL repeat protein [Legionella gratiana]